jgi:hypothetical protein
VIPDEKAAPLEGSVPGQSVFEPVEVAAEPKADQLSAVGVDLDTAETLGSGGAFLREKPIRPLAS